MLGALAAKSFLIAQEKLISLFLFFFVHMIFFNNVMLCLNNESFSIMFLIRKRFLMQNFFSVGVNFVRKREKFHWEAPMWKSVHNVRYNNIYWNISWQRIAMVWESVHYVFLLGLHQIHRCLLTNIKGDSDGVATICILCSPPLPPPVDILFNKNLSFANKK